MFMKNKLHFVWRILIVILINIIIIGLVSFYSHVFAYSQIGSQGQEVTDIQTKLIELGFLSDEADGIFGPNTRSALIEYQKSQGLSADGIAGDATLSALGISANSSGQSGSTVPDEGYGAFTKSEVELLAKIISAEARGEPYDGQVAVGAVIMNRIHHPSFPNTMSGVIYQPQAFSCLYDGGIDAAVADSAYTAAREAINGSDPSGGAVYYYNPDKATSEWIFSRPVITVIGAHRFCS